MKYLNANGKYYELRWMTGYTTPVSIRSRTVVHDEVFLIDRAAYLRHDRRQYFPVHPGWKRDLPA